MVVATNSQNKSHMNGETVDDITIEKKSENSEFSCQFEKSGNAEFSQHTILFIDNKS